VTANPSERSESSGMSGAPMPDDSGLSDDYVDLPSLAARRLSDGVNCLIEAIRSQPLVAAAIIAAGIGVSVGIWMANRPRSRREALRDAVADRTSRARQQAGRVGKGGGKGLGRVGAYGELLPLALKLLENPVVRALIIQSITRRLTRR
jgi:hypothetical protein